MNKTLSKALKRTVAGNHFGYCNGYYVFIYRRPHGCWCCRIGKKGEWIYSEGYHGTSLKTVHAAKAWAKNKIVNPPKQ